MRSGSRGTRSVLIQMASGGLLATVASALLAQTPSPAPAPTRAMADADRARLDDTIKQALKPLSLDKDKIGGAGGIWLAERLAKADIVMIGETHGTGSIARAAGALVDALPTDRPLAYAQEIGPAAAAIQEPLLRGPPAALDAYMADPRTAISFAFLNLREEADFARKLLARSDRKSGAYWGLDQEFATAAPLLLDRLGGMARTGAQKAAIAQAREHAKPLMTLARAPDSFYDPLDAAFVSGPKDARTLLADMRFSSGVFRSSESASNRSNREREDYMKRQFMTHWRAAGKNKPRVVMKFGAYHLTAGLSPTATPALGAFVNALALMEDKSIFSVMIVCGPDGEQINFRGKIGPCGEDFEATAGLFRSRLFPDSATLIETAPLRSIPGTLRRMGVSEDMRTYIQSYDAIIILKGAKAATPFAPPPESFFTGM